MSSSIVAHTHLFVCLWINTSLLHCLIYLQTDSSLLCSPSLSSFIHTYTPSHVHQCICLRMELPSRIMGSNWSLCPCLWRPKKGHCFIANMKRYDPTSHSPLESPVNLRCLRCVWIVGEITGNTCKNSRHAGAFETWNRLAVNQQC